MFCRDSTGNGSEVAVLWGWKRTLPQKSVRDAKCPGFSQVMKIRIYDNVYEYFDFPAVGENIHQPTTNMNKGGGGGGGRCVG